MVVVREMETELGIQTSACIVDHYSYHYPTFGVETNNDRWALADIDLDIAPGDVVAVFGDSGCGKTTLFNSIAGFNHHFFRGGEHKGNISLFGQDVAGSDMFALARNYGIVSQDFRSQLLADQVAQAVAFPLENQAVDFETMHARVEEILQMMGLVSLADRNIAELSGGEGQSVVIAAMLAKNPRMMIFDDVASDLDQRGQARIKEIIEFLKQNGVTTLIVDSSSPRWLLETANKALVLKKGKQTFFGAPENILADEVLTAEIGAHIPEITFREGLTHNNPIRVEHVSYSYNGHLAVDDVSAQIHKGAITGIIGHNGSGKTTLAKIVAGIYKPQNGSVHIDGIVPYDMKTEDRIRHITYTYQNPGDTFFTDTVENELAYSPKAAGMEPHITAEMIGLTGYEQEHPDSLSTGLQQRLALGNALSTDPEILILDEPTKGLNQQERAALVNQLLQLQESGKTIIVISHDWPMIGRLTNNSIVMDHGRIVAEGATKDILQDRELFDSLGLPLPW